MEDIFWPSSSSSRSVTETIKGSHELVIQGYSLAKGIDIGKYIASDEFTVGDYEWAIYFYPHGKTKNLDDDYVSVFVALESEDSKDVRVLFELTLLDLSGKGKHKVLSHFDRRTTEIEPCSLKRRGSMWGYKRFFRRTELESSDYLKDDCLKITCTVGVVVSGIDSSIHVPDSHIGSHFGMLLESIEDSGIIFNVPARKFHAQELVPVKRYPIFRTDFEESDNHSQEITLKWIPKAHRNMHLLDHDSSKSMDILPHVVNYIYDNFTSIVNVFQVAIGKPVTKNYLGGHNGEEQQLIGFVRWALKWCVDDGGVTNKSLVNILTDIESYFINNVSLLLLNAGAKLSDLSLLYKNRRDIGPDFHDLWLSIQNVDLIFWENIEPSIFMFSAESVMGRLNLVINASPSSMFDMHRQHCVFLKEFIQLTMEHTDRVSWEYIYPRVECALDMMSLHVFHSESIKTRIDEFIHAIILHILVRSSGVIPPFSDELMMAYVEYIQKVLLSLPTKSYQIKIIQDVLSLVCCLVIHTPSYEINQEKFSHMKTYFDTALRKLGHIISSLFFSEFDGVKASFEISCWLTSIFHALLLPLAYDGFLGNETLIRYAFYFRHYLCQLPTNEYSDVKSQSEDESEFDKDLVFVAGVVFYQGSEYHVEREILFEGRVEMVGVFRDFGSIIWSSLNNDVEGNIPITMNPGLPYLLAKLERIKIQFRGTIYPTILKRLSQNTPETNLLGFFDFLLENLKKLRICNFDLISNWKDELQIIHEDLVFFRSFLQNIQHSSIKDDRLGALSISIRNAAYIAEYIINALIAGAFHICCRSFIVSNLIENFNLLKEKVNAKEIIIEGSSDVLPQERVPTINSKKDAIPMSRASHPSTDVVEGFEVERMLMMNCLASNLKQLDVVSIVGMPGIGKSTLARKVYEDPFMVNHFQLRAWCCVSQEYDIKELFLSILGTDGTGQESCEELSLILYKQLKERKYLIVLDDIWDIDVFYWLKRFFPNDNNGSRIVVTSRTISIGVETKCYSNPIELHPLSDAESWNILKKKIFPKEECPLELFEIGTKIARKCGGLPLAVVVVAGILAKPNKEQDVWEDVAERLNIYTADDSQGERRMKALDLSYEFLPDHLKPLFLYVGAFPEDHNICADNLKWLWIAEGFIRETENRSLEDQAESYLMDLIDRSLLMVSKRKSDGSVTTCRIHDLIRDMTLAKAKDENFMQHHHIEFRESLPEHLIYPRRVSASLMRTKNKRTPTPSTACEALPHLPITYEDLNRLSMASRLNSILLFSRGKTFKDEELCKSIFQNHKVLRVFNADRVYTYDIYLTSVTLPVHLRYLSITRLHKIPASLFTAWNLETLIINKGSKTETKVPVEVWKTTMLRHLHIGNAIFTDVNVNFAKLENLQTLSRPLFLGEQRKLIRRFPNLQTLDCIFKERRNIYEVRVLESLHQLKSVKVVWDGIVPFSAQLRLPLTLKNLSLLGFKLQWKDISIFEKLPNLEVLKLQNRAVEDELWDVGDREFRKLKFLKLKDLNIKRWIASDENFPCLQNLVLHHCHHLEKIPSSLGHICDKIEVKRCSRSASKSATRIQQKQEEMGNSLLKVYVSYPWSISGDKRRRSSKGKL